VGDDIQLRWRRDLHAFVAMVVAAIVVTTATSLLLPTRYAAIADERDLEHGLALMLLPGILAMLAMYATWYIYPFLAWGHERWPFGARTSGGSRPLIDVLLPNLLGFVAARLVPAPFEMVSSTYFGPGLAIRVDAPVDVASRFVVFLAAYSITWIAVFAVGRKARLAWSASRASAQAVAASSPTPVTDAA
jgi:hypothetical protein